MNKSKKTISIILSSLMVLWNFTFLNANASNTVKSSVEEVKKVEQEILKLQWNLFDNSKTYLETLTSKLKNLANYEENWNSKIDLSFDHEYFWSGNFNLSLDNYKVKSNIFDSESFWNFKIKSNYNSAYSSWFSLDLTTFASLIAKDWEIYALLKDFNFEVNDKNIEEILLKLKDTFKDNKYVKLPSDETSKEFLNILKSFDLNNSIAKVEKLTKTPLFTPYSKVWESFLLLPTRDFCNNYFEIQNHFWASNSWYTPTNCSDSVYKNFVKEFLKSWELSLTLWETNKLSFVSDKDDTKVNIFLEFKDEISWVSINIIPTKKEFKNEWFTLDYKSKDFLKVDFRVKNWKHFFNFNWNLDSNNNFKDFNSKVKFSEISWNITLENNKLNWFYTIKENNYSYDEDKYFLKNVYWIKVSWNTKTNNLLDKLDILTAWVSVGQKDKYVFLKWIFNYNNWDFLFNYDFNNSNTYWDNYLEWKINWKWKISEKLFDLKLNYLIEDNFYNSINDTTEGEKYNWDFNLLIDQTDLKNNLNFYFDINNLNKKLLKISFVNDAKRVYLNDVKIEAPKDFIDFKLDEFFKNDTWYDELINY